MASQALYTNNHGDNFRTLFPNMILWWFCLGCCCSEIHTLNIYVWSLSSSYVRRVSVSDDVSRLPSEEYFLYTFHYTLYSQSVCVCVFSFEMHPTTHCCDVFVLFFTIVCPTECYGAECVVDVWKRAINKALRASPDTRKALLLGAFELCAFVLYSGFSVPNTLMVVPPQLCITQRKHTNHSLNTNQHTIDASHREIFFFLSIRMRSLKNLITNT